MKFAPTVVVIVAVHVLIATIGLMKSGRRLSVHHEKLGIHCEKKKKRGRQSLSLLLSQAFCHLCCAYRYILDSG